MKRTNLAVANRWTRGAWVALVCSGMLLPTPAWAATGEQANANTSGEAPSTEAPVEVPATVDVALAEGGLLQGVVVDPQGNYVAGEQVVFYQHQGEVVRAGTDPEGRFTVQGLRAGTYTLVAGEGMGQFRLWAPGTAPPAAKQVAMLVNGNEVVRGSMMIAPLKFWLTDPLVITAVVATAVAVPVAVHNARLDKDQPSASP